MDKQLLNLIEEGRKLSDGHFTLMAFTTHWKAMFFIPDLDTGAGRRQLKMIKPGDTPREAVLIAVDNLLQSKGVLNGLQEFIPGLF